MAFEKIHVMGDAIRLHGRQIPEKVALIFREERLTYGQILERSNRLANALLDLGVEKGDKVAFLIHNVPEFTICYFAVTNIGAVLVPVNVRFKKNEIRYVVEQSDAVVMILTLPFLQEFEAIRPELGKLRASVLIDRPAEGTSPTGEDNLLNESKAIRERYISFEELIGRYPAKDPDVQVSPEDEQAIWYTSGTTGFPKGAVSTHKSGLYATKNAVEALKSTETDAVLMVLPLFHNGYQLVCYATHFIGGTVDLMESFNVRRLQEEIQNNRPTIFMTVPTILTLLLNDPERSRYDLSSLRKLIFGASLSTEETIRKIQEAFPCEIYHAYGQSEYTPGISMLRSEDFFRKFGSIGTPMGNEIVIMDDSGKILPPNTPGEICVRGGGMMKGYYKKPEETARIIRDGWLHTTDMGYKDEDGFLFFLGRMDDTIDRGGENIHPKEIEDVLYRHPKVRDAAVIGVPDSVMGAAVAAFIVLKKGEQSSAEEIRKLCEGNLADYKVPRYVEFVEELPMNASGKILKTVLREREMARYRELGSKVYEKAR